MSDWDPQPAQLRDGESTDERTHAARNAEQLQMATNEIETEAESSGELPALHIGDHVSDREDEDGATMLVVGLPVATADEYEVGGQTIAEYNPDYPAGDDVVEVIYPQRTDVDVRPINEYAFPRSRLALEQPIHELEDGGVADE